jgi:hypothetical protein
MQPRWRGAGKRRGKQMRQVDRLEGMFNALQAAGIERDDAWALRRIAMTLHRWHELECGDGNDHASWTIARGRKVKGVFEYDDAGKPYLETHYHQGDAKARYTPVPDRERGAQKRLGKIMARYPGFTAYVQGDPRGAALYILRPGDVPEGADVSSCYNRGVAVFK